MKSELPIETYTRILPTSKEEPSDVKCIFRIYPHKKGYMSYVKCFIDDVEFWNGNILNTYQGLNIGSLLNILDSYKYFKEVKKDFSINK